MFMSGLFNMVIYIGFWQGPFPKAGWDKMSFFQMICLGSFYSYCQWLKDCHQ